MNFAIIGCGLIGQKRAKTLAQRGHDLKIAADLAIDRAERLAGSYPGASAITRWQDAISSKGVDAVIVATTNEWLAPIAAAAAGAGKHVLTEKPAARSVAEIETVIEAARNVRVQVGFNHRYHPAMQKTRDLLDSGALGPLMFLRARYGHGGRIGYDKEWRADPQRSGGGELIDQGVHLIDLARWILGDFASVQGSAKTYFWDMPVDDNAFLNLETAAGQIAWLHVSCTEWKNLFAMEIYGRNAKIDVQGLGGTYGVERLAFYRMLPQMGPPETTIWEYPGEDQSWSLELVDFEKSIADGRDYGPTLADARAALAVIERIYRGAAQAAR